METMQTQKTVFCCPHHGVLQEKVEYTSAIIESKRFINIPIMLCPECNEYYTPFTNLLALGSLQYNGKQIRASKGRAEKGIPRVEVLKPSFVDVDSAVTQDEGVVNSSSRQEVRVVTDLTKLTKAEIEYLCRQMAPREIRSYFQKFPKDFTRIRPGFRPNSLSDEDAINLMIRHSEKPFIWSFIENTVKIWLEEIDSYLKNAIQQGSSPEEALLKAIPQSVFADNPELYLSLTEANNSPEFVSLLKSATAMLGNAIATSISGKTAAESAENVDELAEKIIILQRDLDAERAEHLSATQALAEITAQNAVLQQNLLAAEARIDAAATKSVQMQAELEILRKLARFADSDTPDAANPEYEYTSICQVYSDYYTGQTWLTRLADISAGKITRFARMEDIPPYFGNRDRLFWRDGPHEAGYIGIWHWNAVPNKTDPSTDYVTTSFNKQGKVVEIVELPDCRTYEEIVRYLGNNNIPYEQGRKYFFALSGTKGSIPGLLCNDHDFDIANGMAKLKATTSVLPQFVISSADILSIAGKNYYRFTNLGTPQDIYHVKSPFEVVKDIVISRATSAALRQQGISKKEAQHCQVFLKDLPVATMVQEVADIYSCSEAEAAEYVTSFISFADAYLNETDLDIGTLASAISRNPDMVDRCKHLLEAEWRAENDRMLNAAQAELDQVTQAVATKSDNAKKLEEQIATLLSQISDIESQISSKLQLADDVEAKVAERIAAAKSNAADFICEMAFAGGRDNTSPVVLTADNKTPITRHKIRCDNSGSIDEIDLFEEELACNFNVLGYNASSANQMAQVVTFCICNRQPIFCGSNGSAIADAIAATLYAKGAYEVTMPIASDRCIDLCEAITSECTEENAVILLNGVFDGYSMNSYTTILQYSSNWDNNRILVFSIAGIDPAALPITALDNAWFIDGDAGLTQFPHGSLSGFATTCKLTVAFDEAAVKAERKKLKAFTTVLSNRATLNYAGFLAASEYEFKKSDLLFLQLLIQGRAMGKVEEITSAFEASGIELSSNAFLKKYL